MIDADKLAKEQNNQPHIKGPETIVDKQAAIAQLNAYNNSYVETRKQGKPFNQQIIEQLSEEFRKRGHDIPEPADVLLCPVGGAVFNTPVKVITIIPKPNGIPEEHEHFFDYSSLIKYSKVNQATFKKQKILCTNPLNQLPIQPYDLLPAPEMQERIDAYINSTKAQLRNLPMPAESSRSSNKIKK